MKNLIIAVIAVFTIGAINAQEAKFGVKGGLNFANISGDSETKMRTGFNVGALLDVKISEKFHFQPEVLYSTQGFKVSSAGQELTGAFDYINIPLIAKYYVVDKFNIQAGPQLGFLVAANAKGGGVTVDVKDQFKAFDFGLNFGLGYDISDKVLVDFRYNLGLTGMAKEVPAGQENSSNRVIALSVGYKF